MREKLIRARAQFVFLATLEECCTQIRGVRHDGRLSAHELEEVERCVLDMLRAAGRVAGDPTDDASRRYALTIDCAEVFFQGVRQSEGRITAPDETARLH